MRTILIACLLLGGCVSTAEQCQRYGFKPDDPGFPTCVMTVEENHKARVSRDLNDTGNMLMLQGALMQRGYRP